MRSRKSRFLLATLGAGTFLVSLTAAAWADHVTASETQAELQRPIKLGVSGSSKTYLQIKVLPYCYAGTLGLLLKDNNDPQKRYLLSNNHVLAKENMNFQSGTPSENAKIIQNGLLDDCTADGTDDGRRVADLTAYVPVQFYQKRDKIKPDNKVDAAIAEVWMGANGNDTLVDPAGTTVGIGTVSGPADAVVNMRVQKTGRTTLHNFGFVTSVNVEIDVKYESGTARFVNQIGIRNVCDGQNFSAGGDSGSAIMTVSDTGDPAVVGLLFAGGDGFTIANKIGDVLAAFNNGEASNGSAYPLSVDSGSDNVDNAGSMNADYDTVAANCPPSGGGGRGGGGGGRGGPPRGAANPAGLDVASEVKARHSNEIFALPDVIGHGIGADENGNAVIEIYIGSKGRRAAGGRYPVQIEGVPVRIVETGPITPH